MVMSAVHNVPILKEFKDSEAILSGHFILSSGLHTDTFLQCSRVMMDPKRATRICAELARKTLERLGSTPIDYVVSLAMGGVIVGYEISRQLSIPSVFCERIDDKLCLRRGYSIPKGKNILLVEDVVDTGRTLAEVSEYITRLGANVVGAACLIDRSAGKANLEIPLISLLKLHIATYQSENLPEHLREIEPINANRRLPTPTNHSTL